MVPFDMLGMVSN